MKRKGQITSSLEFNSIAQAICDKKFHGDKIAYLKSIGYAV